MMKTTQSTAPPQSSELTLTRVMSPNGSCPNNAKVMNQINDHSCSICTQSMGNKFWVCCRCYAYGHPGCIQITVVERRQSLLMGQLHYFVELERERRQPHQQGNRFSKQWLRHGRPVSRRTIAPRQRCFSCSRPTSRIYQTYTINAKVTTRYYSCSIRFWILSCLPPHVLSVQV